MRYWQVVETTTKTYLVYGSLGHRDCYKASHIVTSPGLSDLATVAELSSIKTYEEKEVTLEEVSPSTPQQKAAGTSTKPSTSTRLSGTRRSGQPPRRAPGTS